MKVSWNYYDNSGKEEGIVALNHCIEFIGTEKQCEEWNRKAYDPKSGSYHREILPSKVRPNKFCLHVIWNGFYD